MNRIYAAGERKQEVIYELFRTDRTVILKKEYKNGKTKWNSPEERGKVRKPAENGAFLVEPSGINRNQFCILSANGKRQFWGKTAFLHTAHHAA